MVDEPIDGYADKPANQNQGNVQTEEREEEMPGPPDPGINAQAPEPLSPDEFARLKEEARREEDDGNE